ncbi:hypothetical protein L202_02857 [Cryptococcus amylolentus CBS 6039]|uniref:COP9 signalosome complex subunit 3 N-terminal helical repeats domain-containing protein n=1 Tax=Cryptococcus amylolentus CBS 6039 TaxID=1295533 RepID=A0A1E3HWH6_9TREE|nr:hypothetical protein L202_02857 [Cryptococcus amylolentus CBS 6039]ODN80683.1 hypothetical protein L202_02857 [Cryptococcus amylolentus CBS 6039]
MPEFTNKPAAGPPPPSNTAPEQPGNEQPTAAQQPAPAQTSTKASASASSSAPPSHAHPAFPPAPPLNKLPTTETDIISLLNLPPRQILSTTIPLLAKVADGKPFEGANLKPIERKKMGENILTLYSMGDNLYGIDDEVLKNAAGALVFILSSRMYLGKKEPTVYNDRMFEFSITVCALAEPAALHAAPSRVGFFAWELLRLAQHLDRVNEALSALAILVEKLAYRNTFSATFGALLEACLLTRKYDHAPYVLDQIFLDVTTCAPKYLDFLTYYHHAGTVAVALGDFKLAKRHFVMAVTLPTHTASAIQIACAKRAILCELITTGKKLSLPKYTPVAVSRVLDKSMVPYNELAKEYDGRNWKNARKAAAHPDFEKDCNRGLADLALNNIYRHMILRRRSTYSRLTVEQLVDRMRVSGEAPNVEEVMYTLDGMVRSGEIEATLTPSPSNPESNAEAIINFSTASKTWITSESLEELHRANQLSVLFEKELVKGGQALGTSKGYLQKAAQSSDLSGKKGTNKGAEFDQLMDAEDSEDPRASSGSRQKRNGVRGVGGNLGDMGF